MDAALSLYRARVGRYGSVMGAFDCSGLGIYALQKLGLTNRDMNANTLMGKCELIDKSKRSYGCWVFCLNDSGRATHIGYIVKDDYVIHSAGRKYGVIKEKFKSSYWDRVGIPSYFKDEITLQSGAQPVNETPVSPTPTASPIASGAFSGFYRVLKLTKPMMRGEDVKQLQTLLDKAGLGMEIDGIFGKFTQDAVMEFQDNMDLIPDGKAGKLTISALGGVWKGK